MDKDKAYVYFDVRNSKQFYKQERFQNGNIKPSFDFEKENGDIIYGKELSYLGRGENSTVWEYESNGEKYAIKIFFDIGIVCALEKDVYWKMKNLSLNNTLKALETLNVINSTDNGEKRAYYAYIMEYLEEKKDYSIVDMPVFFFFLNASLLELDAKTLANSNVVMQDAKIENTIFNKLDSHLYLSDIDMYFLSYSDSLHQIRANNKIELQFLFYQYFTRYSSDYYQDIYNDFFNERLVQTINTKKSVTDILESIFSPYDTPRQFFEENKSYYYKRHF